MVWVSGQQIHCNYPHNDLTSVKPELMFPCWYGSSSAVVYCLHCLIRTQHESKLVCSKVGFAF